MCERRGGLLNVEEELLRKLLFPTLPKTNFKRFLNQGTRQEVSAETQLTRQGEAVSYLILIADGLADIHVNEELVATCRTGDLVGEISFLTKGTARRR